MSRFTALPLSLEYRQLWEQSEAVLERFALDITHLSFYPQPFTASASFALARTPWYLDYGHLTFWFFFFASGVIVLWLVYMFLSLSRNVEARHIVRETRGYSRAQTGDTVTAVLPLTWSVTMLAHASVHSSNFDENTNATVFSFTVVAYQWGWNYYFPREIAELLAGAPRIVGRGHVVLGQAHDAYASLLAQARREYLTQLISTGRYTARHGRYSAASVLQLLLPAAATSVPQWAASGTHVTSSPAFEGGDSGLLLGQKAPLEVQSELYFTLHQYRRTQSRFAKTLVTRGAATLAPAPTATASVAVLPYGLEALGMPTRPVLQANQAFRPATSAAWVGNRLANIHGYLATSVGGSTLEERLSRATTLVTRFMYTDATSALAASPINGPGSILAPVSLLNVGPATVWRYSYETYLPWAVFNAISRSPHRAAEILPYTFKFGEKLPPLCGLYLPDVYLDALHASHCLELASIAGGLFEPPYVVWRESSRYTALPESDQLSMRTKAGVSRVAGMYAGLDPADLWQSVPQQIALAYYAENWVDGEDGYPIPKDVARMIAENKPARIAHFAKLEAAKKASEPASALSLSSGADETTMRVGASRLNVPSIPLEALALTPAKQRGRGENGGGATAGAVISAPAMGAPLLEAGRYVPISSLKTTAVCVRAPMVEAIRQGLVCVDGAAWSPLTLFTGGWGLYTSGANRGITAHCAAAQWAGACVTYVRCEEVEMLSRRFGLGFLRPGGVPRSFMDSFILRTLWALEDTIDEIYDFLPLPELTNLVFLIDAASNPSSWRCHFDNAWVLLCCMWRLSVSGGATCSPYFCWYPNIYALAHEEGEYTLRRFFSCVWSELTQGWYVFDVAWGGKWLACVLLDWWTEQKTPDWLKGQTAAAAFVAENLFFYSGSASTPEPKQRLMMPQTVLYQPYKADTVCSQTGPFCGEGLNLGVPSNTTAALTRFAVELQLVTAAMRSSFIYFIDLLAYCDTSPAGFQLFERRWPSLATPQVIVDAGHWWDVTVGRLVSLETLNALFHVVDPRYDIALTWRASRVLYKMYKRTASSESAPLWARWWWGGVGPQSSRQPVATACSHNLDTPQPVGGFVSGDIAVVQSSVQPSSPIGNSAWLGGLPETQSTQAAAVIAGDPVQANARNVVPEVATLVEQSTQFKAWRALWTWQAMTAGAPWDRMFRLTLARRPAAGMTQAWLPAEASTTNATLALQRQQFSKNATHWLMPRAERVMAPAWPIETGRMALDIERGSVVPVWAVILPLPYLDVDPLFVHRRWSGELNTSRRSDHDARLGVLWGPLAAAWATHGGMPERGALWSAVSGPSVAGGLAAQIYQEVSILAQHTLGHIVAQPHGYNLGLPWFDFSPLGRRSGPSRITQVAGGVQCVCATSRHYTHRALLKVQRPSCVFNGLKAANVSMLGCWSQLWAYSAPYTPLGGQAGMVGTTGSEFFWLNHIVGRLEAFNQEVQLQAYRLGGSVAGASASGAASQHPIVHTLLHAHGGDGRFLQTYIERNQGSAAIGEGPGPYLSRTGYSPINAEISSQRRLRVTKGVYLPADVPMHGIFGSKDVIHSWAIPGLGVKIDCIPGYSSHRRLVFRWRGLYWGQCMEVCGRYHHWMPILVRVVQKDVFLLWCLAYLRLVTLRSINETVLPSIELARSVWTVAAQVNAHPMLGALGAIASSV